MHCFEAGVHAISFVVKIYADNTVVTACEEV